MMLSSPGSIMAVARDGEPEPTVRAAWLRYRAAEMTLLALPFAVATLIPLGAWRWGGLSALVAVPLALLALAAACELFVHVRGALAGALGRRLLHPSERMLRARASQWCPMPLLLHSWHDGELGCAALDGTSDGGALFLADRESGFRFVRIDCARIVGLQYLRGTSRNLIVLEFLTDDRQRARRHLPFADTETASRWNQDLRHLLQAGEAPEPRLA